MCLCYSSYSFGLFLVFLFSPHENGKGDDDKTANDMKDKDTAIVEQVEDMLGGVSHFGFNFYADN